MLNNNKTWKENNLLKMKEDTFYDEEKDIFATPQDKKGLKKVAYDILKRSNLGSEIAKLNPELDINSLEYGDVVFKFRPEDAKALVNVFNPKNIRIVEDINNHYVQLLMLASGDIIATVDLRDIRNVSVNMNTFKLHIDNVKVVIDAAEIFELNIDLSEGLGI